MKITKWGPCLPAYTVKPWDMAERENERERWEREKEMSRREKQEKREKRVKECVKRKPLCVFIVCTTV